MKFSNRSGEGPRRLAGYEGQSRASRPPLEPARTSPQRTRKRRDTGVRKIVIRKPTAKALLTTGIHSVAVEEAVLGVVGQAEDEVADEAAQRQQQHPARPLGSDAGSTMRFMMSKQAQAGVRQRRGERGGVDQALERPLVKEPAVEMQHDPDQPDRDRAPADQIAEVAPDRPPIPSARRAASAASTAPGRCQGEDRTGRTPPGGGTG